MVPAICLVERMGRFLFFVWQEGYDGWNFNTVIYSTMGPTCQLWAPPSNPISYSLSSSTASPPQAPSHLPIAPPPPWRCPPLAPPLPAATRPLRHHCLCIEDPRPLIRISPVAVWELQVMADPSPSAMADPGPSAACDSQRSSVPPHLSGQELKQEVGMAESSRRKKAWPGARGRRPKRKKKVRRRRDHNGWGRPCPP